MIHKKYYLSSSFFKQLSKCSLISALSTNIIINKNARDTNNDNFKSCDDKKTINNITNKRNHEALNNKRIFLGNLGCNLGPYTAKNTAINP